MSATTWALNNVCNGSTIPLGRYERDTPTLLDYVTNYIRSFPDSDYSDWVLWVGKTNYRYTLVYANEKGSKWAWMHGDREVC